MKIRKIIKRVGNALTTYEYLAEVDWETDVTKYGHEKLEDRYKTDVFSLEVLEQASNFKMYISEISDADYKWWKDTFNEDFKHAIFNSKFFYRYGKMKLRKLFTKILN